MKAITLYDVARVAGVSYQTVSRVINDAEHVSPRTREKVRQAMAELHYVPNRGAQQLAGKRTRTLGLITADLALHAPSQIASAVKSRAVEQGASVLISMVDRPARCGAALQELLAQRVEALLVNVPLEDTQAEALQDMASPVPVLFLDVSPSARVNSLVFDAGQGASLGAEHLLSLGHRRIALLAGPESSVSARARLAGWKTTLAKAGVDALAVAHGDWSAASGYEKGHHLLAGPALPEAILVANDQMALGVMRACAEKGIAIPGQISVVGFDDTADSAWFSPPLTTVRQAFREAGERSVEWLLAPARSETRWQKQLPVTLIVRHSTAPRAGQQADREALAQQLRALALLAEKLARG
ncbi:LacI family DNA-binding transcriptional regulator [Enterobacter cloacae complex sp. P40RS]|uniref:LacI family DNA-binding transcriptional regulator n=1 Tax=Enterobacter pasteurii TaxID=3029761 RepID=A0ABR9Q5B3_9ENTR|nr:MULTISPECIES: LacI family DNA-binding transcriptional regulator [Enterobacter cloacae complex]MBE4853991.1 LacI family DNA-binding transcriptional regulator [Enterobacter pasteurii]MBE4864674.1 LacI family DNA-binding transcriptional regulator [Enterobacter cloacae complex sp. P40C2]MBE4876799.1 LacI family DNA-binding transcriptional regulator [Enterobacter cloacae complex sp. P40C]HAS1785838.1 LacI family DNA-binding transcriptional regulator [Enterobacter pasteurii]